MISSRPVSEAAERASAEVSQVIDARGDNEIATDYYQVEF